MTVREALNAAEARLRKTGTPDARLDAEYMLAEALRAPRLSLLVDKQRPVPAPAAAAFEGMLARREKREPLQYILGEQGFMGFSFRADARALIPRNDTECICEAALAHLEPGMEALDLCTGSGAIAVALKKLRPAVCWTATDLSEAALSLARENARRLGAEVEFLQGDLFAPLAARRFDLIVSNPPYIPLGEREQLQREVRMEPEMALFAGTDGLDFYRRIAREAPGHLNPGGYLILEIGDTQFAAVAALLEAHFEAPRRIRDLNGLDRGVAARLRAEEGKGGNACAGSAV